MEQKVLIPSDISQPGKDYLRERGYVIKMGRGIDEQTIMEDAADCDALLARNEHITRGIMEAAPHLKVISKHGVGLDKIDLDAARDLNIWVTNGPLSNTVAVAEHTMMLILACAKKLVLFDKAIRNGDYEIRNRVKGMDLEGKTLGLLGLGKIGHMVAKKAINGFGMKVLGYADADRVLASGNVLPGCIGALHDHSPSVANRSAGGTLGRRDARRCGGVPAG